MKNLNIDNVDGDMNINVKQKIIIIKLLLLIIIIIIIIIIVNSNNNNINNTINIVKFGSERLSKNEMLKITEFINNSVNESIKSSF